MVGRSQTSTDTMSVVTPEMQQLELVRQLWLPTRNASGLGFDPGGQTTGMRGLVCSILPEIIIKLKKAVG